MGKLLPVLAVLIILGSGVHIFREPEDDRYRGLLIPCYIFLFATFLLLCEMRIYPKSLRKMGRVGQTMVEYFIATFLMENLLVDFWIPLELQIQIFLAKASVNLEDLMQSFELNCGPLCEAMGTEDFASGVCSVLGLFFLISVLQATRAIDFRQLRCGFGFFIKDIIFRLRWYFKRTVMRSIGLGNRRRVQIRGVDHCKKRRFPSPCPPDPCQQSVENYCSYCDEFLDDGLRHTFSDFEMTLNEDYY